MLLFLLLSLSIHLCTVETLTCLTCQGIIQPRHCRSVEECAATDTYCSTERVTDTHGQPVYNLGCMSSEVCVNGSVGSQHKSCRSCCSGDLCNAEGCEQPGYPKDRGPICYDCPMTIQGTQCRDITFCQPEETCSIQSRYEFGDELFLRACVAKDSCDIGSSQIIVGKREPDSRVQNYHCDFCCSHDLCNKECTSPPRASDCYELLHQYGETTSGIYTVYLKTPGNGIDVYCDMETSGGGWTIFQHRASADVDFYRNMSEYVQGFGNVSGNFWLGLETVYEMTSSHFNTLYIKLEAADGTWLDAQYQNFSLSPGPGYAIHVGARNGTKLTNPSYDITYANGYRFSTYDKDQSGHGGNCPASLHGAWWYNDCMYLNLNGEYVTPGTSSSYASGNGGMIHFGFRLRESLKQSNMMFRTV